MTVLSDTSPIILEKIVGDWSVVCDYSENNWCPDEEAKWVMNVNCPGCGWSGIRLGCTPCKEMLLTTEDAVECTCGEVTAPARHCFSHVEALNR